MDGTDTVFFVAKDQVPRDRIKNVTYGQILVDYRPQKDKPHRTRLTVGGNLICYSGYVRTPTADIITSNIIINSNIPMSGARYMFCDIKNFFLGILLIRYEYIKIPIDVIPEEIILEYNLMSLAHNGYVYCEIWKLMCGIPQAGIFSNKQLVQQLETKGYAPCKDTPGLQRSKWVPISFSLVVDNFGVKYVEKQHA